jgi:transcriptional regulator with XRE-family HTH domain
MKLREWRERRKKSQPEAAVLFGVTAKTIHSWEAGKTLPPRDLMPVIYERTMGAVTPNDFYPDIDFDKFGRNGRAELSAPA